jgi:hypothetical protein
MKKLLFVIVASMFLLSCGKEDNSLPSNAIPLKATTGKWVVFSPGYTTITSVGTVLYSVGGGCADMTIVTGPPTGGSGKIIFSMTGGTKYRATYTTYGSNNYGSGSFVTPNGVVPKNGSIEWTSGDCFVVGGGCKYYGINAEFGFCGIKFERYQ